MRIALVAVLVLAGAAWAGEPLVEVMGEGQFYHRPGHLVVDGARSITLTEALKESFVPCPECQPDVSGEASGYYRALLAERASGAVYRGVPLSAAQLPAPEVAQPAENVAAGAQPAAPAPKTAYEKFPTEIAVPGTNGQLKVPTFKGSGGIVAVPLQYGGYTVVQPPPSDPPQPAASAPAPSAR